VLATLAVLALLAATLTLRLTAQAGRVAADEAVAAALPSDAATMRLAMAALARDSATREIEVDGQAIQLVDVGGLVDLNAASPALLERLIGVLGGGAGEMARYRDWRAGDRRLQRTGDLPRITGLDVEPERLARLATVFSGRTGLAVAEAPIELLDLLGPSDLPSSSAAGTTVQIRDVGSGRVLGTARLSVGANAVEIVQFGG
jgi:hypothetical protein